MSATVFVDTNVLVYARDRTEAERPLILGAASHAGCTHVLTQDLQDGQAVEAMTIIDPFTTPPSSVLRV